MSAGTEAWVATEGTVTSCRYQFARLNTLTLGIQRGKKFRITFDYYAHGQLYSDEFQSPVAIPQNERVPVSYDPARPERNSRSSGGSTARAPLWVLGVAGSLVLSFVWLALLRGCS